MLMRNLATGTDGKAEPAAPRGNGNGTAAVAPATEPVAAAVAAEDSPPAT
jgi:hypothetical protein